MAPQTTDETAIISLVISKENWQPGVGCLIIFRLTNETQAQQLASPGVNESDVGSPETDQLDDHSVP